MLRTRESAFNTPLTGKYWVEEETKVAEGMMSVRIRLKLLQKDFPFYPELFDSIIQRRFSIYQQWLSDVKKSGIIDKNSEGVEVPAKPLQKASIDPTPTDSEDYFRDQFTLVDTQPLKLAFRFLREAYSMVVLGNPETRSGSRPKQEEAMLQKVRLIQVGQGILLGLLLLILLIQLFGRSRK